MASQYVAGKLAMMAVDAIFHKQTTKNADEQTVKSGSAGMAKAGEQGADQKRPG